MKEKLNLIRAIKEQQEVANFEQSLKSNPLTDKQVNLLPAGVRLQTMDYVKSLKDTGLIVPEVIPTRQEMADANPNAFVISRSAVWQMTQEEYRQVRQSGLFNNSKLLIQYPDVPESDAVVHYKFIAKNGTQNTTGANEGMIKVLYKTLDKDESVMNHQLVVDADNYYKAAKKEIEMLLVNLESIKAGQFNKQAF